MIKEYLKLPLRFEHFFEKEKMPTCDLVQSIYRNLHLIITTFPDENKIDEHYGNAFWDTDYDIHMSNEVRRKIISDDLIKNINRYEKRISNVDVSVGFKQSVLRTSYQESLRKRIEIVVVGKIKRNSEPFRFETGFYIGPYTLG